MKIDLMEKNAVFLFDKEGVIVITDIKKNEDVVMGELLYDGKNVAILNRNDKEFFALKNIAPLIREKIKQSKFVTVIEKDKDNIYSYQIAVHLKDDLGFVDDFEKYAEKIISELKEKMTPEEFEEFSRESRKIVQEIE
ncbi:MAG: hypothetical protein IKS23_02935 [Alphaproteobacteria bacterium]|nr:hypothetical protein [Alphaproteobacteria bacterium]